MSGEFRIRRAVTADAAALIALARAVGGEPEGWLVSGEQRRGVGEERRYLRALRRYPHAAVLVAEASAGIIGRLSIARDPHPASQHVADLGLIVAAAHRRRGIGRALMEGSFDWAREAGIRKLELHVLPHNDAAIALYDALGFEREGYRREHYRRDDAYLDAILMARRLA